VNQHNISVQGNNVGIAERIQTYNPAHDCASRQGHVGIEGGTHNYLQVVGSNVLIARVEMLNIANDRAYQYLDTKNSAYLREGIERDEQKHNGAAAIGLMAE